MLQLPGNRILRSLLIASTVAVILCYSWLAARLLEPGFTPPSYISDVFVRAQDSRVYLFEERVGEFPRERVRLSEELDGLTAGLLWIGSFKHPLEILVDERDAEKLLVTDSRIEIGRAVVEARGQLAKSVLRAWILQNGSAAVIASHLRLEVASDVLLAMVRGSLSLQVPGVADVLEFDDGTRAWWTYADSYNGVCKSAWRSLDLMSLCRLKGEAVSVSELSFRPFIGSRIWKSYQALPLSERLPFIRKWVDTLRLDRAADEPSLKDGWLAVVSGQLERLLPSYMDPLAGERASWKPQVDAPLIVIDGSGHVAAPGTLKVADLPIAHAHIAVMTAPIAPSLGDVLRVDADRVVWKPEGRTDFVEARPSALRLAISRQLASPTERLDSFIERSRNSQWFGLTDAKWDAQASAYQVRGAIQAVDAFRLKGLKL